MTRRRRAPSPTSEPGRPGPGESSIDASAALAPPPRRPGQLVLSGVLYALWIGFLAAMAGLG